MEKFPTTNVFEKQEPKIEREKFEKIAILLRHPSVDLGSVALDGDDNVSWDSLEDKAYIERGAGHEMSQSLASRLIDELPEITKTKNGQRAYGVYSSPIHRAEALARYINQNLKEKNKQDKDFILPVENIKIAENFAEIPMAYKKGEILKMVEKVQQEGRPIMSTMEEWFKSDPEFIASVFEKERARVLAGLDKLKNDETSVNLVFTHRLVTGFMFWLLEHQNENRPITAADLPEIMQACRNIPYASESELGYKDGSWSILRKQDTKHLEKKLIKGTF